MSGGEWLIRQRGPETYQAFIVERIPIDDTDVTTAPAVYHYEYALVFQYANGRRVIYPWANIVSAEYRPHPEP